jgi:DNA-binding CsgD family transcriptional regulator
VLGRLQRPRVPDGKMSSMRLAARPGGVGSSRASAVRDAVVALSQQALDPADLVHEVEGRVRAVVPYDAGAWWTVDPETLLPTQLGGGANRPDPPDIFSGADYDIFDDLDRSALDAAAGEDAVHVLSRSGNATWATARFSRTPGAGGFTQPEVDYLCSVARYVGAGVREYLSQAEWRPGHSVVPGVLIVAGDGRVDDATPEMTGWLARLGAEARGTLPVSLRGLVRQTLDQRVGEVPLRPAKVRIRLPEGDWVVARATRFTADATRTAVLMKSATRSDVGSLFLAVHGLTPREREITELLVAGAEPGEVAACLHLSIHTVRSHVKTIFAKVGVGSRAELTASLTSR